MLKRLRGKSAGVVAALLVIGTIAGYSAVASAEDGTAAKQTEPLPAFDAYFGLQSWPHAYCLDSNDADAYPLGCNGGNYQRYAMRKVYPDEVPSLEKMATVLLQDAATGRCLDSNDAGEVYPTTCQGDNVHEYWEWTEDYRTESDGRVVMRFRNAWSKRWLALGDDVYATADEGTFDRDFAISW